MDGNVFVRVHACVHECVCVCAVCVCAVSRCITPWISVSVEADELAVELGECSGHWRHFLPLTPPTVVHLHRFTADLIWIRIQEKYQQQDACFCGLKPFSYLDFIGDLVRWIVSAQYVNPVSYPHCSCVEASALEWPLTFPHTCLWTKTIDLALRRDTA